MKAKNISSGPINLPLLGRDVDADETIEVPDDTNLPADYFQQVTETKSSAKAKDKE